MRAIEAAAIHWVIRLTSDKSATIKSSRASSMRCKFTRWVASSTINSFSVRSSVATDRASESIFSPAAPSSMVHK